MGDEKNEAKFNGLGDLEPVQAPKYDKNRRMRASVGRTSMILGIHINLRPAPGVPTAPEPI